MARGLKDPSLRVIQNHFAISGNLGDVAAKVKGYFRHFNQIIFTFVSDLNIFQEEVWEVSAQLLGLGLGILVLVCMSLFLLGVNTINKIPNKGRKRVYWSF